MKGRRDPALLSRMAISENGFVFDPVTGNAFTLNATGLALLRIFQQHRTLEGALEAVAEGFEVATPGAGRDVLEFVAVPCGSLKP